VTQNFEQSIVQGRAHWITSFVHEAAFSRLLIWLSDNDDTFKPTQVIEFTEIQQFESRWSDRKDGWIEGLIGAHEEERGGLVLYLLVTDQREIELTTRAKALIHGEPLEPASTLTAPTIPRSPEKTPRS
jgi:hypothetical protein